MNKKIEITQKRYDGLLESERKLEALECNGVDNWCGYSGAMEMMDDEE